MDDHDDLEEEEVFDIEEVPSLRTFSNLSGDEVLEITRHIEAKVVIVGGGPVGLWFAAQLKLRSPELYIVVIEKHSEYQRSHVLRLSHKSFKGYFKSPELNSLLNRWGKVVRTNVLENDLHNYVMSLGVPILQHELTLETLVFSLFPNAIAIIGADGAHSISRSLFFGESRPSFRETLQHTLLLKYEVNGKTRGLNLITERYPTMKLLDGILVEEHVGKYNIETQRTPVTLQMIISQDNYQSIGVSGMRASMNFSDFSAFPFSIKEAITIWLNVRRDQCGEERIAESEQINVIPLDIYKSNLVAKNELGISYFLVGDAAFAVPYFRALNNGLLCGTYLADLVCKRCSGHLSADKSVRTYTEYVNRLAESEFNKARSKRRGIKTINFFTRFNSKFPWQFNAWSRKKTQDFKSSLPEFT